MQLQFSLATHEQLPLLQQLFKHSIQTVCKSDYSKEQLDAWSNGADSTDRWLKRMDEQYFLLAWSDQQLIGFCSLRKDGYLDLLFVHKDWQGLGIATQLYIQIENEARTMGITSITTDASKTAKPFFEARGFDVIRSQSVEINGVSLTNFAMIKRL